MLLKVCESQLDQMNANYAKDIMEFLARFRYLPFRLVDSLTSFCVERTDSISPSLLIKCFLLCFDLGYTPANIDRLIPLVARTLNEYDFISLIAILQIPNITPHYRLDKNGLYGIYVLRGALGLILHDSLPSELIYKIFSVGFLERLDSEVAHSSSLGAVSFNFSTS